MRTGKQHSAYYADPSNYCSVGDDMKRSDQVWDVDRLSQEFLVQAENAKRYLNEVRRKLHQTKSYELIFDETLATFMSSTTSTDARFLNHGNLFLLNCAPSAIPKYPSQARSLTFSGF